MLSIPRLVANKSASPGDWFAPDLSGKHGKSHHPPAVRPACAHVASRNQAVCQGCCLDAADFVPDDNQRG